MLSIITWGNGRQRRYDLLIAYTLQIGAVGWSLRAETNWRLPERRVSWRDCSVRDGRLALYFRVEFLAVRSRAPGRCLIPAQCRHTISRWHRSP
jgi:hypothetical protein